MPEHRTSQRPYLYRALHEWMTDNGQTPHIVVDASHPAIQVPSGYVEDGRIVLNIGYDATNGLELGNDAIRFAARFGGQPFSVFVPEEAVLAIYARESGEGMVFAEQATADDSAADDTPPGDESSGDAEPAGRGDGRSHLRVIK